VQLIRPYPVAFDRVITVFEGLVNENPQLRPNVDDIMRSLHLAIETVHQTMPLIEQDADQNVFGHEQGQRNSNVERNINNADTTSNEAIHHEQLNTVLMTSDLYTPVAAINPSQSEEGWAGGEIGGTGEISNPTTMSYEGH
jgi:hypothetical protein